MELHGDRPPLLRGLQAALQVTPDDRGALAHVHGFHSYPARLHPLTAARLIEAFAPERGTVLDPFCGSGTVLVEAVRLGRSAIGVDVNPLAIELAWLKTRIWSAPELEQLQDRAEHAAASAEDRRLAKVGPSRRYSAEDLELYDIHVLLELDGLKLAIDAERSDLLSRALRLVFSALLTKFSKQTGDSGSGRFSRRVAGGKVIAFFVEKTRELCRRLAEFARLTGGRASSCRAELGDARALETLKPKSVDLIVSSPPYPGVYDYIEHHRARLRWLGLDTRDFEAQEIGSRRQLSRADAERATSTWRRDFGACLAEFGRVLRPGGALILVMADSVVGGRALYAEDMIGELARRSGLKLAARASQLRPYFHRATSRAFAQRPRKEHVLWLEPDSASVSVAVQAHEPARADSRARRIVAVPSRDAAPGRGARRVVERAAASGAARARSNSERAERPMASRADSRGPGRVVERAERPMASTGERVASPNDGASGGADQKKRGFRRVRRSS